MTNTKKQKKILMSKKNPYNSHRVRDMSPVDVFGRICGKCTFLAWNERVGE